MGNYNTGNRILAERMAVLESAEPHQRSLIVDSRDAVAHERHRPRWEEVLGVVGSCQMANEAIDAMMRADPNRIIMAAGLCHYTLDHYLTPLGYRPAQGPPATRIRRAEIGDGEAEFRVLAPDDRPGPHRAAAERMFAAIDADDFGGYLALENPPLAQNLSQSGEARLSEPDRERLERSRAHFAAVVKTWRAAGIGTGGLAYGLAEASAADDSDGTVTTLSGPDHEESAIWCHLRKGASSDDLPALQQDIDNDPSRPYFCVEAGDWVVFGTGTLPSARVPLSFWGFPEATE
jgi:hypothetical protein